jgi:hypothetical protein
MKHSGIYAALLLSSVPSAQTPLRTITQVQWVGLRAERRSVSLMKPDFELLQPCAPLVTTHQEFDDSNFAADQKRQENKLRARAKSMGFQLVSRQGAA